MLPEDWEDLVARAGFRLRGLLPEPVVVEEVGIVSVESVDDMMPIRFGSSALPLQWRFGG